MIKLRIKESTVKNREFQLLLLNGYNLIKAKMNADKEATEQRMSVLFTCDTVPVTGTQGSREGQRLLHLKLLRAESALSLILAI